MCANKNQSHVRCPLFVKATSLYKSSTPLYPKTKKEGGALTREIRNSNQLTINGKNKGRRRAYNTLLLHIKVPVQQQLLSSNTAVSASPFSSPRCLPPHTIYHEHQMEDDDEFGEMPPMSSNRRSTPQYLSFVHHSFMVWPLQPSIRLPK
ncbi:hypothetical protein HanRHA438_Chr14g0676941 [Helianthus annuus]|nr:hypothetical protein HanRHA438_Chr14g0676941 [Helianthus annuus]